MKSKKTSTLVDEKRTSLKLSPVTKILILALVKKHPESSRYDLMQKKKIFSYHLLRLNLILYQAVINLKSPSNELKFKIFNITSLFMVLLSSGYLWE
ncbi:MAG: hypothetical protein ACFFB2_09990 [Promethearchaeota archaeon]